MESSPSPPLNLRPLNSRLMQLTTKMLLCLPKRSFAPFGDLMMRTKLFALTHARLHTIACKGGFQLLAKVLLRIINYTHKHIHTCRHTQSDTHNLFLSHTHVQTHKYIPPPPPHPPPPPPPPPPSLPRCPSFICLFLSQPLE